MHNNRILIYLYILLSSINSLNSGREIQIKTHGSSAPNTIKEWTVALTGFGQYRQITCEYSHSFGKIDAKYNQDNPNGGKTLTRGAAADIAIQLYKNFCKRFNNDKEQITLNLFGPSHGGTIMLLFTEVLKAAEMENGDPRIKNLDPDIKSRQKEIREIRKKYNFKIEKVNLITVGTPVSKENNDIVNRNIAQDCPIEIFHKHFFSKQDTTQTLDPGLASHYWHGLPGHGLKRTFAIQECDKFHQFKDLNGSDHITLINDRVFNKESPEDQVFLRSGWYGDHAEVEYENPRFKKHLSRETSDFDFGFWRKKKFCTSVTAIILTAAIFKKPIKSILSKLYKKTKSIKPTDEPKIV